MNRNSKGIRSQKGIHNSVVIDGQRHQVQRRERIRGRLYLLLQRLAPAPRERWLAFNTVGGQPCSFLMLPKGDGDFQRLKVLRRVECNSLPKILDWERGRAGTRIVMPWKRGITVREYLRRVERGKVAPPEPFHATRLILELARGLNALHRHAQVIHGDVTPANLILTHKPSHLSLIDFGSAWLSSNTGFRAHGDGSSNAFAAPELRTDGIINDRADQFSAMVVLYQLLTGVVPYEGLGGKAGWPEFRDDAASAIPPSQCPISRKFLPRRLWQEIDALVLKGVSIDPQDRFAHSCEWIDALESVFLNLRVHRSRAPHLRPTVWDRLTDFADRFFGG